MEGIQSLFCRKASVEKLKPIPSAGINNLPMCLCSVQWLLKSQLEVFIVVCSPSCAIKVTSLRVKKIKTLWPG